MANGKKDTYWIGFDLGGTKMLASVFDPSGKIVGSAKRRTKGNEGAEAGLERITKTVTDALKEAAVKPNRLTGIGMACPGPLDLEQGILLEAPNLGWSQVPICQTLESVFECPTYLMNDVDAGVFGEYSAGAARKERCVLGVFPGTGIGGGCVYQGRVLTGAAQSCMEFGHIPVNPQGEICGCGRRGCLETVASRLAIASQAAKAAYRGEAPYLLKEVGTDLADIRSGALAASVKAGDKVVEHIIRDAAATLGRAIGGVVNLLAPDIIVLGGGLVEAMPDLYCEEVKAAAKQTAMPSYADGLRVKPAELGDDASVTGAAAWARTLTEDPTNPTKRRT